MGGGHTPSSHSSAGGRGDWRDLALGGGVQCAEAITLGMPFEVWKTQQISSIRTGRVDTVSESFAKLWAGGVGRFWKGSSAKMTESFLKGGVLFWATQAAMDGLQEVGVDRSSSLSPMLGGFIGGVSQTVVMSPLTYVVTYRNAHPGDAAGTLAILRRTGLRGTYSSAPAMAMRQGSNWALRFMFAKEVANQYKKVKGGPLNIGEEIMCGIVGGALGCINQPAEVLRVVVQSRHAKGEANVTTRNSAAFVYKHFGLMGFYTGIIPRMGLSAWQTLFMYTFAGKLREVMRAGAPTSSAAVAVAPPLPASVPAALAVADEPATATGLNASLTISIVENMVAAVPSALECIPSLPSVPVVGAVATPKPAL